MKQIATILFLSIALFNLGGYRLLTGYLQTQANRELETRLDQQAYSRADLVLIKTPLHLPYYSSSVFERVSGEMLISGVVYKYVERRVYNDTLELLCIKDAQRTSLQQVKNEFCQQSNGLLNHAKKGSTSVVKPLFFDYCTPVSRYAFAIQLPSLKHTRFYIPMSGIHPSRLVEQPPEA